VVICIQHALLFTRTRVLTLHSFVPHDIGHRGYAVECGGNSVIVGTTASGGGGDGGASSNGGGGGCDTGVGGEGSMCGGHYGVDDAVGGNGDGAVDIDGLFRRALRDDDCNSAEEGKTRTSGGASGSASGSTSGRTVRSGGVVHEGGRMGSVVVANCLGGESNVMGVIGARP